MYQNMVYVVHTLAQQFVKTFYIESESGFILVDCLASLAGWLLYQLPCLDSLTAQLAQITRS